MQATYPSGPGRPTARRPSTARLRSAFVHRWRPREQRRSARQGSVVPMTTTLTAHGPEDLLAPPPVVLGFRPEHSLVMLTFHARHTFHARVDLPPSAEVDHELPELREVLLAPCLSHEVGRVAFVVYGDDPTVASAVAAGLVPAFEAKGVE